MLKTASTEKANGYFDYERWDVYQAALDLIIVIRDIVEKLPRGNAYLADQLQRAGASIPLNIAEGSGEHALPEKARFYRMAKRSATECASIPEMIQQSAIRAQRKLPRMSCQRGGLYFFNTTPLFDNLIPGALARSNSRFLSHFRYILDVCRRLEMLDEALYIRGRELLLRIVAMLTKMSRCDTSGYAR